MSMNKPHWWTIGRSVLLGALGLWLAFAPLALGGTYEELLKFASTQVQQQQFGDAVDTLKVAIRLAPHRHEGFGMLGLLLHGAQLPKEAQEAVTEALKRVPAADRAKLDGIVAKVFPNGAPVVVSLVPGNKLSTLPAATKEEPWANGFGMKFVPVPGTEVLFCIWETRVRDYLSFVRLTRRGWSGEAGSDHSHPVSSVSLDDAKAFCSWLTTRDRGIGTLNSTQHYRLPTDLEWSASVGLPKESGGTPKERSGEFSKFFPWGSQWPPPQGAGNYATELGLDIFEKTAPVGSFTPNPYGIYDLGGNVYEWCEGWYDHERKLRIARGASYESKDKEAIQLQSSARGGAEPTETYANVGFRIVLATDPTAAPAELIEAVFGRRVESVDFSRRTFKLEGDEEQRFSLSDSSTVRKNGKPATIGQLEIGDTVTVRFTPSKGEAHQVVALLIGDQKQGKKKEKSK